MIKDAEANGTIQQYHENWKVQDGLLVNDNRKIWVPNNDLVRTLIVSEEHELPFAGHRGQEETARRLKKWWWWPSLTKDAEEFMQGCDRCQRNKVSPITKSAPPQTIESTHPCDVITLDFICGLTPAAITNHTACLVITDKFTRMI